MDFQGSHTRIKHWIHHLALNLGFNRLRPSRSVKTKVYLFLERRHTPLYLLFLKGILSITPKRWKEVVYRTCRHNPRMRINPRIYRLPFGLVLKNLQTPDSVEADALRLLDRLGSVHTPYIIDAVSTSSENFLLTTWVEGETLGDAWDRLSSTDKQRIVEDLRSQFGHLRRQTMCPATHIICNASGGPINDPRVPWIEEENPRTFQTPQEFAKEVWVGLDWKRNCDTLKPLLQPLIDRPDVPVTFSHGDILPKNLILPGGLANWRSSGIPICVVDWEYAGWMLVYWDALKATWIEIESDSEWLQMIRGVFPECNVELDADWQWRSRSRVTIL